MIMVLSTVLAIHKSTTLHYRSLSLAQFPIYDVLIPLILFVCVILSLRYTLNLFKVSMVISLYFL